MKIFVSVVLLATVALAACSGDNAEKAAAGTVSKAVELVKGAATGANKGVEEGRKASTSVDGALIVTSGKELGSSLRGEVLEAKAGEAVVVTLGFTNPGDVPVRVTELAQNNHVTALDGEGYACTTRSVDDEFTVPAKAKLKVEMAFACGNKAIAKVRLFDAEYVVAPDRIVTAK
jgi:hypothetical protein